MADPATNRKARAWTFTINNPTDADDPAVLQDQSPVFAVWSLEHGENNTPHWQGFVRFKNPRSLAGVKKLFPRAHLEIARGTDADNLAYCTKAPVQGPYQIGEPVASQGKRNDWHEINDMCKRKAPDSEIAEIYPGHFARNFAGIQRLKTVHTKARTEKPEVTVCYGPPGTGKTYYCAMTVFEGKHYEKEPNTQWWDLYEGQEDVLLDEFKGQMTFTDLKRFLDRYDYKVQCKGGYMRVPAKRIMITSNYMPDTWYDFNKHPFEALSRRVEKWIWFYDYKKFRVFTDFQEFKTAVMENTHVITDNSVSVKTFSWNPEIVDLTQ